MTRRERSRESQVVAEQLSKTFDAYGREVHAVLDLSLEVRKGELFGLFGPNGAGKTTLIRMLATLLMPTSGTASVNGFSVVGEEMQVRASLGLVASDERSFYGRLNAWQNLAFYASLQNVPRSQIQARSSYVLDVFGLLRKADVPFQSLSTGQKQRLNMARALIHDPPILFLDEPTKSMDVQTSDFVRELIKNELVARQGRTVIFISHDLYEMDDFCDRVGIMVEGRLQAVGTPDELGSLIPRRAVYRVKFEGDAARVSHRWRELPGVEEIVEITRGVTMTTFDVTIDDEVSGSWLNLLATVEASGGRVESYQRVDDGSLRELIRHFSGGETSEHAGV